MVVYFQYFEEQKLLIHRFTGKWSTTTYNEYINYSIKFLNFDALEKIFTDMRSIVAEPVLVDLENITKISNKLPVKKVTNIHLVTDPVLTAIIHLYQGASQTDQKTYSYCSTIEHVIKTLDLPFNPKELEKMLQTLYYRFPEK